MNALESYYKRAVYPRLPQQVQACAPHLNAALCWAYIFNMSVVITLITSYWFTRFLLLPDFPFAWGYGKYSTFLIGSFVVLRVPYWCIVLRAFPPHKRRQYLGLLTTVSFIGSLAFVAIMWVHQWAMPLPAGVHWVWAGLVIGLIYLLHNRALGMRGFSKELTTFWLVYPAIYFFTLLVLAIGLLMLFVLI